MSKELKKVRQLQGDQFVIDLKRVRSVGVYVSGYFYEVKKSDVWHRAISAKINYYITDKIFTVKRNVIVLL